MLPAEVSVCGAVRVAHSKHPSLNTQVLILQKCPSILSIEASQALAFQPH